MTTIEQHFPSLESTTLTGLLGSLPPEREGSSLPFSDDALAFCEALTAEFGTLPDVPVAWRAAAFFFRASAVRKMRDDVVRSAPAVSVARGRVFHVTPANVETQFFYSWLLSVLAGNANVVRVSSRLPATATALIQRFAAVSEERGFERIRAGNRIVSFGHDPEAMAALSSWCDLRVLWGGDAAIAQLRESKLRPDAGEITFPDRFSVAVMAARAYLEMSADARSAMASAFASDVWTFDQMACSSPKALVWVGTEPDHRSARDAFYGLVARDLERRGVRVALVTAVEKMRFSFSALARSRARAVRRVSNELVILDVDALDPLRDASWGGGLLVDVRIDTVSDLARTLRSSDQTLAYGALAPSELEAIAESARQIGLRRLVPLGRSLAFSRVWDGIDLLAEMTRLMTIDMGGHR